MTNVVLALALVFADNMVLQRDTPVPVWGTGAPGKSITVEFDGQKKITKADTDGKWLVTLDPMPASAEPRTLSISGKTLTNVLVGDIWVCAGQSNMEWPLAKDAHAKEELPAANNSKLRLLNMPYTGQYFFSKPFGPAELARMTPDKFYSGTWQPCTPESAKAFSAVGYYFGKEMAEKVPVGLINLAVGGSPAEAWIRRDSLPSELPLDPWCLKRIRENLGNTKAHHPFEPGFLWDAGIARLIPFAIRGVLWYQGESNAETDWRVKQHEMLFPLLVRDWRKQWNRDFPFYYVQLPGLNRPHWPAFRDQQRRFLDTIPNTGMAITLDLGHPTDVHPRNKRDVGHRLALAAQGRSSGPLPRSLKVDRNRATVEFTEEAAGDGSGFELAGKDGDWHPATATMDGARVFVSSPDVAAPVSCRYAWIPFPTSKLTNKEGLPASPFQLP